MNTNTCAWCKWHCWNDYKETHVCFHDSVHKTLTTPSCNKYKRAVKLMVDAHKEK